MSAEGSRVAVVVASQNARRSVAECLGRLVAQQSAGGLELVVVDNSTDGTTEIIRERFPFVRLLLRPPGALIPELWAAGIEESTAPIVAITTAHCVPDASWLAELIKAHEAPVPAIGGAIENGRSARIVDWAIYFCRYSRYMLPLREGFVPEIAGDNASYKRVDLQRCRGAWQRGFWEPAVHAELRKAGSRLMLAPSIVVYHQPSFGVWGFMKQRFRHGRQFGEERASHLDGRTRAIYAAGSPVIPMLYLLRIARQALSRRRHRKELLVCLPILSLFLLAWAIGEGSGYLTGGCRTLPVSDG